MRIVRHVLLALLVAGTSGRALADDAPSYLCAPAKVEQDGSTPGSLALADRVTTREVTLAKGASVCLAVSPASVTLEGFGLSARPRKSRKVSASIELVTRFGRQSLALRSLAELRVPSSSDAGETASHLACYAVRRGRVGGERPRVTVTNANGERVFDVGRAIRVCVPPSGETTPELVCHAVKLARTKPLKQKTAPAQSMTITTRFGTDRLRVGGARELCVPALGAPIDPGDPEPAFSLEITPRTLDVIAGSKTALTTTALFMDGHSEDYTEAVAWSSSDESVARVAPSSTGGVFLEAVGPGTAVVSATDPATGIGSDDTDGNATVTVTWPLEKLVMEPHAATRRPGGHLSYTVTGFFTGGFTKNLTQKVVYSSSVPSVAAAPNTPGNRSRVHALAKGTTTISAVDPISGISTTDSDNDATLRVTGGLSYIVVKSNLRYSSRFPGQSQRFTAIGYFNDGSEINLTQQCVWASGNPAVAVATNPEGDRSRIDAVSPGGTYISCTDPVSGSVSGDNFWVLGALEQIRVSGSLTPADWLRTGESVSLTATGVYEGGGYRNLTQEVTWTSREPEIALATNEPGNRSRFVAIQGGFARAFATHVASGVTSDDAPVTVLGDILGLEILALYPPTVMAVNQVRRFGVRAVFEFGNLNLQLARVDFQFHSSDPSVLEVVDRFTVRGVSPGIAELTAIDDETGLTSPSVPVRVKGDLDHIVLTPATATRGIGEWESFTAIGHYPPDLTELLTQRLTYSSNDESVAIADNAPGERSRVRTVGAGTATITATDPFTNISATATITVLPGTIERVSIEPSSVLRNPGNAFSYTAIGHYPDGSTINVTQVTTWESLVPDVGDARNKPGDRSRVYAGSPGTTTVIARHPSGVSSHDTGDDATFVVKPLVNLALTPAQHLGPVGMTEQYTLVGTFDDATTINLTQNAYYWVDNPTIARADNPEGDRSAVELLAPGYTTVRAIVADWTSNDWYPVFYGSAVGAFLAVEP